MLKPIGWLLRKATRDTTSGQLIAEIDGLRFVAIMSVVLFHLAGMLTLKTGRAGVFDPLAALLSHGNAGVQLFFVISGFVIALPFAKAHLLGERVPQLGRYFFRRLTRLEPPYILNLLILFLLIPLVTKTSYGTLVPHLFASMAYLHNVIYGEFSAINYVAWSLEVELQFYVLAPLIATIFMIRSSARRRLVLAALIAAFAVLCFAVNDRSPRFSLSLLAQAHFFLAGFLLTDFFVVEWRQAPRKTAAWDIVSVASWTVIAALLFAGRAGMLVIVVPVFLAYCGAFRGVWSNRFFSQRLIYVIGGMCYTIYLYHSILLLMSLRPLLKVGLLRTLPVWLSISAAAAVLVPFVLVVCTVLFIAVEKPCMKKDWHLKLLTRIRPRSQAGVAAAPGAGSASD